MTDKENLRSRGREAIVSLLKTVREIQLICDFKSTDVLEALADVYKKTGGKTENVYLTYIVVEIKRNDKRNQRSIDTIKRQSRE